MNTFDHNKFLSTKEVAKLLKINEKMVYSLINDKGLPATKVTGKWLFPRRIVEEWLETHIANYKGSGETFSIDQSVLLIAGSDDPLLQKTLSLFHAQKTGITLYFASLGSMGGLKSLRQGQCQIGVSHLLQDDMEYNFDFAADEFERMPVFVNFSRREQGILLQKGNPKNIQTIADLARPGVSIVNRPLGTGTRILLDHEIAKSHISSSEIKGYQKEFSRHLDVGLEVLSGRADAAPAIRAVAGILNLDFMPIRWERFDLLIEKERFFDQKIQKFISFLHEQPFRELAHTLEGYDISLCGRMIYPNQFQEK